MNIFPIRQADADKSPWVVKMLYVLGYLFVIGAAISGAAYGGALLGPLLAAAFDIDASLGATLGMILGVLLGVLGSLIASLPMWALAMIVDDLHAIRVQTSGYAATGGDFADSFKR